MVRTICTPEKKQITLPIPGDYVGTPVEILIFSVEETKKSENQAGKPVFGCAKGQFVMSDDFDAPLEDFKDYM